MKTYYYEKHIQASPELVHERMLNHDTYRMWTKPFSESSDIRGDWSLGSKIYFTSGNNEGNEMGMIATIDANIQGEIVIIRSIGILGYGEEHYSGTEVDPWKHGLEVYRFKKTENGTHLICSVELDGEEHVKMFEESWPKALNALKEICEKS